MFFLARTVVKVLEGSKKMVCGWELDLKVQNSRKGWGGRSPYFAVYEGTKKTLGSRRRGFAILARYRAIMMSDEKDTWGIC